MLRTAKHSKIEAVAPEGGGGRMRRRRSIHWHRKLCLNH